MKKIILSLSIVCLLVSCVASYHGTISVGVSSEKNIQYQDVAFGVSKARYFLGIGGLSHNALVFEAKKDLFRNFALKPGESYANFTVDFKRKYFLLLFYSETKVTITADIIKSVNDSASVYTNLYREKIFSQINGVGLFNVGDTVIFKLSDSYTTGNILSIGDKNKVMVTYTDANKKVAVIHLPTNLLFSKTKFQSRLKIGDKCFFLIEAETMGISKKEGTIEAIGKECFLVKYDGGKLREVKEEKFVRE